MQEEISFGAGLLRDLQDEGIPVSTVIRRILEWPPINQNPAVRKRLRWELHGFPEKERVLVKHFGRLVKRAGLWEPFFGPVEELETFIRIRQGSKKSEGSIPEPGGIIIRKFWPEFLDDEEEVESTTAYLRKLRRFVAEVIVGRYFILTERFMKHFDWML